MEIFKLFGSIFIDSDEAYKSLSKTEEKAGGVASKLGNGIKTAAKWGAGIAAGATVAAGAVMAVAAPLVKAAAEAQALGAQFEQVFGDAQKDAQSLIDGLGKDFGMVPNRIKPAMTQMTSMFKGLGMSTEDAMGTAKDAVTMVADAAAFYDKSFEDANSALNSFIKGNYEGGESIGLFANETQLAAYASKELGLDWKKLDEAGKQVARLDYAKAMQESAGATGQAARESDSLENQLGNLRQAWQDIKAKFGAPILAPAVAGIQKLSEWLQKVDTTKITAFAEWVIDYFKANVLPVFVEWYSNIKDYFPVIKQVFTTVFTTIWEVAKTAYGFFKDNVLPIFISLFTWVQGHMPTIRTTFQTVFSKVVEVAKTAWAFFKDNILPILERLYGFIQSKMPQIQRIVEGVFSIISSVVKTAWDIFENLLLPVLKALWDYIVAPAFKKVQTIVENVFSGIFDAVDAVVWVFEKVTGAIQKAVDWLSSWNNKKVSKKTVEVEEKRTSSSSGGSRAFATGTNFAPGGVALVGERGPELVHLPRGSKVKTANETRQLFMEQQQAKQTLIVQMVTPDKQVLAEMVVDDVTRIQTFKQNRNLAFEGGA